MIIGISGKMNSGKDTVGKILQYFTIPEQERTQSIEQWMQDVPANPSALEIRKFAERVNACISLMLDIPADRLALRDVKNSVLPKQWNRWILEMATQNIGETEMIVCSSKDEAMVLINYFGFKPSEYQLSYQPITVRQFTQWFATDAMRKEHPNIWVNALFSQYRENKSPKAEFRFPNWAITDLRFANELERIKPSAPAEHSKLHKDDFRYLVRVNRTIDAPVSDTTTHESEIALDEYTAWDYVIDNDCSLDELAFEVHTMLKSNPEFSKYFHV